MAGISVLWNVRRNADVRAGADVRMQSNGVQPYETPDKPAVMAAIVVGSGRRRS